MKVAVLADLHLPERSDTVKESILDWALRQSPHWMSCKKF